MTYKPKGQEKLTAIKEIRLNGLTIGILYYGTKLDREYAEKVVKFTEKKCCSLKKV